MKYNIIAIPDIHWGVINPYEQLKLLEFIFQFIKQCYREKIRIDMIVIAGDYFDSKLPLNSKEAILAIQWMNELYQIAVEFGIQRIRIFQGTLDHDNDQLDVFKPMENISEDKDFLKVFTETTSEETLPGLRCIYCPDEIIQTDDYEDMYVNEILSIHDIGFFHGSFDVVYGELLRAKPELMNKKNVIFKYSLWDKVIYGPMISGHWHDGKQYDDLYYCGSPFRYKFNEDEDKGLGFLQYDTEDQSYFYRKITNCMSSEYITHEIYSNIYNSKEDFNRAMNDIDEIIESFELKPHLDNRLRIMIYIVDDKTENDLFISSLRQKYIDHKNVKIVIKNRLKDKLKREDMKRNKERHEKFDFIYDKSKDPSQIIYDFIHRMDDAIDIPIEFIQKKIDQYMHKG